MEAQSDVALKEWAIICDALRRGEQTILLRKGGILDRRQGEFHVEHREFFLFPTFYHEKEGDLVPSARRDLAALPAPSEHEVQLGLYATVEETRWVEAEGPLIGLAGLHVYSEGAIRARYAYRKPGMWVVLVRAHALAQPHVVPNTAEYAGCVSWVRLDSSLPTAGARPVLGDEAFARQAERVRAALG